jgi:ATP-dependent Zn protease
MLHGPGRSGIGLRLGRGPGDRLADTIDAEVRRIVEEALDTATRLLSDNLDLLHRIAFELLRVEVLEGEQLDRLVGEAEARRRAVAAE